MKGEAVYIYKSSTNLIVRGCEVDPKAYKLIYKRGPLTARPLNFGKVSVPPKNGPFEGVKIFLDPPKKNSTEEMDVTCAFCKKIEKNPSNLASAVAQTFHCRI